MTDSKLFKPLRLPNGTVIPNRIAKAAMEENLADEDHVPGQALVQLYQSWAQGGAGLIITGNVMVDRYALTGPAGVVNSADFQRGGRRRAQTGGRPASGERLGIDGWTCHCTGDRASPAQAMDGRPGHQG